MVNGAGLQLSLRSPLFLTVPENSTNAELTDFGRKVRDIHKALLLGVLNACRAVHL